MSNTPNPTPPPAPTEQPVEVKLETGQVYRGKDLNEVVEQLVKAQTEASKTLSAEKQENERLRGLVEQAVASQSPQPPIQGDKFDQAAYLEKWQRDPLEAQDYLDSYRLGIPAEEVRNVYQATIERGNLFNQHLQVGVFLARHPEYPGGEEYSKYLMDRMAAENRDWTADNLESVYHYGVREGKIKPMENKQEEPPNPARFKAPPNLRGSANIPDAITAENMSTADLEKVLRSSGALKY